MAPLVNKKLRKALAGSLIVMSVTLAGCTEPLPGSYTEATYQPGSSKVDLGLSFVPGSATLQMDQESQLSRNLSLLDLQSNDSIVVLLPGSSSPELIERRATTAGNAVAGTRAQVRIVTRSNLGDADPYPNLAVVQVLRPAAVTVVCPNQGRDFTDDVYNRRELMVGCVNAINVADMAHRKSDLISPRKLGANSSQASILAVEKYRTGKTTDHSIEFVD